MPVDDKVKNVLSLKNVSKSFYGRNRVFEAVNNVSLDVRENEFLVLLGPGQCGKSVLLNIISGLDTPTMGEVEFPDEKDRDVGFVFQKTAIFPWKTVMENVELPLQLAGVGKAERREKAQYLINLVGLQGFEDALPKQLSGGMKQRVGIARALVSNPEVIFADEPTGNLASRTSEEILGLIQQMAKRDNHTLVMVTHDPSVAKHADRVVNILDGLVVDIIDQRADHTQTPAATPESVPTPKNTEEESA